VGGSFLRKLKVTNNIKSGGEASLQETPPIPTKLPKCHKKWRRCKPRRLGWVPALLNLRKDKKSRKGRKRREKKNPGHLSPKTPWTAVPSGTLAQRNPERGGKEKTEVPYRKWRGKGLLSFKRNR